VTHGWHTAPLGELTQFINGLWKGEDPPFVRVGVIRNTNFTKEGALDDSDIAYLDVEAKKFQKRRLQFGDLILEKSGGGPKQPVGRVVFFDKTGGDFSFSNFTAAIRVADPTALDARFLHKYLHWVYVSGRTEAMQSHSTGIRNLNGDAYKALKVAYPSLTEQRRIVAILDEAFEGIATAKANAEKNLQNARELFESHLEALFAQRGDGWFEAPIGECFKVRSGDFLPAKSMVLEGGIPVYGGNGIAGSHNVSNLSGDQIVIGRVGAKCGNVRHVCGDIWLTDNAFYISKYLMQFYPAFLARVLNLKNLRQTANQAAQPVISYTTIKDVMLSFPVDTAVQCGIAARLDELEEHVGRIKAVYERKLAALDELKKSLLHLAFTGALTDKSIDKRVAQVA
jgi:type I restriction enzyme, S subunit